MKLPEFEIREVFRSDGISDLVVQNSKGSGNDRPNNCHPKQGRQIRPGDSRNQILAP